MRGRGLKGAASSLSRIAGEGGRGRWHAAGGGAVDDPILEKIVAHLARVASGELPEAARQAARIFTADSLAVGIAAAAAPWRAEVLEVAAASGGRPEATLWGGGGKLPLVAAAMVN